MWGRSLFDPPNDDTSRQADLRREIRVVEKEKAGAIWAALCDPLGNCALIEVYGIQEGSRATIKAPWYRQQQSVLSLLDRLW